MLHPSPPAPDGPYAVGATRFVRPVREQVVIGDSRLCACKRNGRGERTCEHALEEFNNLSPTLILDEVQFVAYYPTEASTSSRMQSPLSLDGGARKGMRWFIKPVSASVDGYQIMAGDYFPGQRGWLSKSLKQIMSLYGSRIRVPVYENAPLLPPPGHSGVNQWPLVAMTHGLTGNATTYSTLCMHLASQGRVVLALEHRDGSGAATFPRSYNGAPHIVRYLSPGEVIWPDGATSPRANEWVRGGYNDEVALRLRKDQLDFRRREIYEAIHAIGLLHEGQRAKSALEVFGDKSINWDAWKGAIDTSNVDLIGHSFGGATVFSILSQPPPSTLTNPMKHYPRIPIRQTLALDPWMEPLPSPGPKPYSDDKNDAAEAHTHPQLLVINSESLTLADVHFSALQSAVAAFQPSRILTLVRAEHVSFSDLPVLLPRRLVGSKIVDAERVVLRLVCKLAHAFLLRQVELGDQADEPKGPRPGAEGEGGEAGSGNLGVPGVTTRTLEYEWVTPEGKKGKNVHKRKRIVGEAGDVIVHRY